LCSFIICSFVFSFVLFIVCLLFVYCLFVYCLFVCLLLFRLFIVRSFIVLSFVVCSFVYLFIYLLETPDILPTEICFHANEMKISVTCVWPSDVSDTVHWINRFTWYCRVDRCKERSKTLFHNRMFAELWWPVRCV